MPDEIKQRFVQVGNKYHFPDGARAFTDHGNRLTSPSENTEVIKSLISIAQVRGWSDITISGTGRFKKEAWFAARLAGLEVRGYTATEFEQGRLVRALARAQAPAERSAAADAEPRSSLSRSGRARATSGVGDPSAEPHAATRERRTLHVGRLVDHGSAHYLHDPRNDMSYFVRIETPGGERDIWGIDLHRALNQALTRPQIGDEIGLRALRQDAVKVSRREYDGEGHVVGKKELGAHRNAWIVEKRDFFRERAQASRVLRDPSVDRQAAVQQHPELLGTYLQLHAAELAAKTLRNPEDQRRFVASVRTALADSVARGEPLATVPLKEPAAQRRESHARSAPRRPSAMPRRRADWIDSENVEWWTDLARPRRRRWFAMDRIAATRLDAPKHAMLPPNRRERARASHNSPRARNVPSADALVSSSSVDCRSTVVRLTNSGPVRTSPITRSW